MLYSPSRVSGVRLCKILGASQIRKPSTPVDLTDTSKVQDLIHRMVRVCAVNGGAGLAAPQIGIFKRVFVAVESPGLFRAYINPSFIAHGIQTVEDTEGCLSVPGKKIRVSRHNLISTSWTEINTDGSIQQMTGHAEGFNARVFQHELDHLNGITILESGKR